MSIGNWLPVTRSTVSINSVAQVVDLVRARLGGIEGEQVRPGQIEHVNVVANAGSVLGRIVGTEDRQALAVVGRDLQGERDRGQRREPLWRLDFVHAAAEGGGE